ncbi:hypothetical protein C1645_806508 [Glomus cerebriforme]|uniref:G domain-containing protein n=1 Tax=Glomus cerebriforme TaxID=658196 RepID=A0A397SVK3_9GLOM|nr:hypothetical protein C1645_806508 [Glomus cerebriforme]
MVEKEKIRNLLIVGYNGGGKSTLADVLTKTIKDVKKTNNFQRKDFEWKDVKYRVVDTIGVEDTITDEKIVELNSLIPEGISQVLFVIDGKFTTEQIRTFEVIFKSGIAEYITIVRTKFSNFKNEGECKKDKVDLNEKINKICKSIVYVDNPPINILIIDDDDRETVENNKKIRARSRTILLDHLEKVCQEKFYNL